MHALSAGGLILAFVTARFTERGQADCLSQGRCHTPGQSYAVRLCASEETSTPLRSGPQATALRVMLGEPV